MADLQGHSEQDERTALQEQLQQLPASYLISWFFPTNSKDKISYTEYN